jgi:caspase domain-containing protein
MKVLIAIGCDNYFSKEFPNLAGAENDATAIFDCLVNVDNSLYDKKLSTILKSPTHQEARTILEKIIFDSSNNLELSFFFAGHGGVKDGAYFLCLNNTQLDRLSASALSITELFMWINEANVRDSNIVIDACHAGGIAFDVATFLKPKTIGNYSSPSLSVLAASAADQYSREVNGQGIATSALLKCLSGKKVVRTDSQSLSLIEIGDSVSELMNSDNRQTPVKWGINLFGKSLFCNNPCFKQPKSPVTGLPDGLSSSAEDDPIIRQHSAKVWELYLASSKNFDAVSFLRLTQSLLEQLPSKSTSAPIVVAGLANTFRQLVNQSIDPFEEVELLGSCISSLLQYSVDDEIVTSAITEMAHHLQELIHIASKSVLTAIQEDDFALLSEFSGIADLYYLPVRIIKILGWLGAGQYISSKLGKESPEQLLIKQQLVRTILEKYPLSIVAISDEQTCGLITFLAMAEKMELSPEAESIFGLMCNSYLKNNGLISNALLSGSDAFKFINARASNKKEGVEELISNPTEFLSALMMLSKTLGLEDVFNEFIEQLDHLSGNIFVPDSYTTFADELIEDGVNHSITIGHGVWCINDFLDTWEDVRNQICRDSSIKLPTIQISAICAALIQPNRNPWFIFI